MHRDLKGFSISFRAVGLARSIMLVFFALNTNLFNVHVPYHFIKIWHIVVLPNNYKSIPRSQ